MNNPRVFLDFSIDDSPPQRVIFQLYADRVPKTVENFRALCTGEKGTSPSSGIPLYYKNSIIHRVIPQFMIQGGDFTKRNGTGGESIYGAPFEDEDLTIPIDQPGLLVMANRGPNTNSAQYFITLAPAPHLLGKHVVFGKVIKGMDILSTIEQIPTDSKDVPLKPITVVHCGELVRKAPPADTLSQPPTSIPEKRRSPSPSHSDSDESDRRERKRRKRESKKKSKSSKKRVESPPTADPPLETEEEYDLRLEREEKERVEEAARAARLKAKEGKMDDRTGIRYKGRGAMKFFDPERVASRR